MNNISQYNNSKTLSLTQKKLTLKNDIVFIEFFSKKGNEIFLKDLLSNLLNINIFKIEIIKNPNLDRKAINEKLCILDIKATLNDNTIIDIEIRIANQNNIISRTVYYSSKLITSQLSKGDDYNLLKSVIIISILDFNFFPFEEYITETITVSKEHKKFEISKYQKYYFIELPKFRNALENMDNKVAQWITFIDGENSKGVKQSMEKIKSLIKLMRT